MQTMRAAVAGENGLEFRDIARPQPTAEQVLVRVAAAGMNRADLNAAKGAGVASKDAFGKPIGMEWAGEIVEVGPHVKHLKAGDMVMCSGIGGYAEFAVADAGRALKLNPGFDMRKAAVLPLALLTAHDAVVTHGKLQRGDAILVQGGSSAVGLMALQIAKLKGAAVIAGTSTHAKRRGRLHEFGATLALDPASVSWTNDLMKATNGAGVNVIVDMVSGPSVDLSMKVAAVRGRMINVGRLGGTRAEFDFDLHAAKRLDYIGVTFRTRTLDEIRQIVSRMRDDLWEYIEAGTLSLPVDSSFPLADARAAHKHMAANLHFGKIVLIP